MIFLGIDCGTQSLKVVAWDSESGRIRSATRSLELLSGLPPGHKEQNPQDWIDSLEECLASITTQIDAGAVRGIGVSGQQHGLVALDADHRVVRAAKLWCDTSTQAQCDAIIAAAGGPDAYMKEIGNLLPPGFTASKVLWMKQHAPEDYRRVRYNLLPHDYLNLYLTGELVAEAGDASGTGYFRVRERAWSPRALGWIDPDRDLARSLPRLIDSAAAAGELRSSLAQKWGFPDQVIVSSGGGDNMMGAIGSGNVTSGVVTVSLGTSGTLFSYSEKPVVDPRGEIAAFCDSTGGWLPLGCTMNVTVATEMVRHGFLQGDLRQFDEAVSEVPPGSGGLILLPYLEGERLPNVPSGTGVLLGLRPSTASPPHLARAAVEGVTLGLFYGLRRLEELGIVAEELRLIGGGAKSRCWRRIVADIFQLPVVRPQLEEGPAMGAALQAFWCASGGEISEVVSRHVTLDESGRCLPDARNAETYRDVYTLYSDLSQALRESSVFPAHRSFIDSDSSG